MALRELINRTLPSSIKSKLSIYKHKNELQPIQRISCDIKSLRKKNEILVKELMGPDTESLWERSKKELNNMQVPEGSGGVNQGDRRAIYYLIAKLQPASVLEVGTHIGASTIHIAAALYESQVKFGRKVKLTSVDILDVNANETKPWLKYGAKYSPGEMIDKLGYSSFVNFVTDTSTHYFANGTEKYDFIFLDGSHAAKIVYQEVPMALKLLNQDGIILLHDYFPGLRALWPDSTVIPGPYLALERLKKENPGIEVLPLGNLPWPTKHGSNLTSLAIMARE